jgi:hypothetical protein
MSTPAKVRKTTARDFSNLPVMTLRDMCRDRGITEEQIIEAMDAQRFGTFRSILVSLLITQANTKAGA